jgi:hypothetical protein
MAGLGTDPRPAFFPGSFLCAPVRSATPYEAPALYDGQKRDMSEEHEQSQEKCISYKKEALKALLVMVGVLGFALLGARFPGLGVLVLLVGTILVVLHARDKRRSRQPPHATPATRPAYYRPTRPAYKPSRPPTMTASVKRRVWTRDGGRCVQCGSNQKIRFDPVTPYSKGGTDSVANLQVLCQRCNLRKLARI